MQVQGPLQKLLKLRNAAQLFGGFPGVLPCRKFSFGGSSGSQGLAFSMPLSSFICLLLGDSFPLSDFGISVSGLTDLQIAAIMTVSHINRNLNSYKAERTKWLFGLSF